MWMLRALYDFGINHPDVVFPVGCSMRKIHFEVCLDSKGKFVDILKHEKGSTVLCPDEGTSLTGVNTRSNVFMEKALVAVLLPSNKQTCNVFAKHDSFKRWFELGVDAGICELQFVLDFLNDEDSLADLQDKCVALGMKDSDVVGFSIDGVLVPKLPGVLQWWEKYKSNSSLKAGARMIDFVTGELVAPARTIKLAKGLSVIGGQASGSALISFNAPAFESYGFEQNFNCPMSERTADIIMDSFNYLVENSVTIADTKFLHWYAGGANLGDYDDPFGMFIDPSESVDVTDDDEKVAKVLADDLIQSPLSGKPPAAMLDKKYYILPVSADAARVVVRSGIMKGSYEDLYHNVDQWFKDLFIIGCNDTMTRTFAAKPKGIFKLLYVLMSRAELGATPKKYGVFKAITPQLLMASINGQQIPSMLFARAIQNIRSGIFKSDDDTVTISKNNIALYQWIKLYLLRDERRNGKEETIMAVLNEKHPEPAYHCGRIMAAYEAVQLKAAPNNNKGALENFWVGFSRSPALMLGNVQRNINYHMAHIKSQFLHDLYMNAVVDAGCAIGDVIPARLNQVQQGYFALGYYQQKAMFAQKIADWRASYAANQTTDADVGEDVE